MNYQEEQDLYKSSLIALRQAAIDTGAFEALPTSSVKARASVREQTIVSFEDEQEVVEELAKFPKWDKPSTWQILSGRNLQPGDGVRISDRTYIVAHKLRFRSKRANLLLHEVFDATSCRRIGVIDFVPAYKGYVHCQNMDAWGVPV